MSMITNSYGLRQRIGFVTAASLFAIMLILPPLPNMSIEAWRVAAVTILMAVLWVSEAIPIPATALLPIVLFPLLEVATVAQATTPFANPIIYLFLGGFIIAIGMEKSNLHRRIALNVVKVVGVNPMSIVLGFLIASAFISMWVSNTATALMMLPIALSIVRLVETDKAIETKELNFNFSLCLVVSIAYGCNIGGIGTLIGTPPNALMAAYMLSNYNIQVGFAQWMMLGVPLVVISLPVCYYLLTRVLFPIKLKKIPGGKEEIDRQLKEVGHIDKAEAIVMCVFVFTAAMWIIQPLLTNWLPLISDTGIAIFGALLLFLIPVDLKKGEFVLGWNDAQKLPWDILILFGGGLSLAAAISSTGLAEWIGNGLSGLSMLPILVLVILTLTVIIFLTEITSNTATAAAFMPILASVGIALGVSPMVLVIPAAIGASCAFMLPVATPPNAIVYSSGYISLPQMARAGFWMNIAMIVIISTVLYTLIGWIFGIELDLDLHIFD